MDRSPNDIAEEIVKMSVHYSRASEIYAGYIKKRADYFHANRPEHKSDNATEKAFDRTDDGVEMAETKMKLKSLEKKMSANRAYLRVLETDARNIT